MSSAFEIPLIQEIEKHPCLYNYNLAEYNRKDTTEAAWNKVSKSLAISVTDCKDKWKNIRSSYVRSLKVVPGKLRKPYYLVDYLQFVLPFLKIGVDVDAMEGEPLINMAQQRTPQMHISNEGDVVGDNQDIIKLEHVIESDNDQTDDGSVCNPLAEVEVPVAENGKIPITLRKKRKLVNFNNYVQRRDKRCMPRVRQDNNAMRYFLLSLLPELESMDESQIRQFKIKVMLLIDEIKTDTKRVTRMSSLTENEKLQKKLINLLIKNLDND